MDLELMDWLAVNAFPEESKFSDAEYANKAYAIFANALKRVQRRERACLRQSTKTQRFRLCPHSKIRGS